MKKYLPIIFILTLFLVQPFNITSHPQIAKDQMADQKYPIFTFNNANSNNNEFNLSPKALVGNFKILLDNSHGQYYNPDRLSTFISLLETYFGTVDINQENITYDNLKNYDLLILPNPQGRNLTSEEISSIQKYVENGGKLLITGDWYRYFNPIDYNNLTQEYGIVWLDASSHDKTNHFGSATQEYYVDVHTWDANNITSYMGAGSFFNDVFHSGTVLEIGSYNATKVSYGPVFIGVPDNDTFFVAESGESYVPGVNYTGTFGFHIALELNGGGKIFASGSTATFSDSRINEGDSKNFVKLVVVWLLGVESESVLLPVIENFNAPTALRPQKTAVVSFTISNPINVPRENMKLKISIPYFLTVDGKITIERLSGIFNYDYIPGDFIDLGTLDGLEKANVSFTVKEVLGDESQAALSIYLYVGNSLIFSSTAPINSEPAISVEAAFSPFYINISRVNYSMLYINITNEVDYAVENISIAIKNIPEGASVNVSRTVIDRLNVGETKTIVIKGIVPDIGAYEFPVEIKDAHGSIVVRRPFLLAITQKLLVFDEGHNQYVRFASPYMQGLINLMSEFGPVLINKGEFSLSLLDPTVTSVIVIPVPQPASASPSDTTSEIFTDAEITGLQSYIDNGGSILLMGNWYQYFWPDNPNSFNQLTTPYGIKWIDGDLYDRVNKFGTSDYQVTLRNFADNDVAKFLTSGVQEVHFVGTGLLQVTPTKDSTVYPIVLGNNESFVTEGPIDANNVTVGQDCILIMAAETSTGGRILASGSSYMFSDYYQFNDNKDFITNMIAWLSKVIKLDVSVYPIPAKLNVGEQIPIMIRVKNTGVQTIKNIEISINLPPGLLLHNSSATYTLGDLKPGEYVDIVWMVSGSKTGTYLVGLTVTSDNYKSLSLQVILNFEAKEAGFGGEIYIIGGVIALVVVLIVLAKFVLPKYRKSG